VAKDVGVADIDYVGNVDCAAGNVATVLCFRVIIQTTRAVCWISRVIAVEYCAIKGDLVFRQEKKALGAAVLAIRQQERENPAKSIQGRWWEMFFAENPAHLA